MIEKKSRLTIFVIIGLLLIIPSVHANLVDDLLAPLSGLNFSDTYDHYSSIIDFIIYTILFIGLAQVTIGKKFESSGGKAMVVAVGMVLAIGLTISESTLGFNLRSFGPLAAAIFVFFIGLVVFLGIRGFGMEVVGSASITIVITYLSIRSVTPGLFDWMMGNPNLAWIHSVLLIAVIISLYKIVRIFFPNSVHKDVSNRKNFTSSLSKRPKDFLENIKAEKEESNFIKTKLKKITNEAGKDSKQIIKDLTEIGKLIHEFGNTEKGKELIAKKVEAIVSKDRQIHQRIISVQEMVQKISRLDIKNFQKLHEEYKYMDNNSKKNLEKTIKLGWKKLDVEKQILQLEKAIKEYENSFENSLELIIASLRSDKIDSAVRQVDQSIKIEKTVFKLINQITTLEKKLASFSNKTAKEISAQS